MNCVCINILSTCTGARWRKKRMLLSCISRNKINSFHVLLGCVRADVDHSTLLSSPTTCPKCFLARTTKFLPSFTTVTLTRHTSFTHQREARGCRLSSTYYSPKHVSAQLKMSFYTQRIKLIVDSQNSLITDLNGS